MPEIAEVETVRRQLDERLVGQTIKQVVLLDSKLEDAAPPLTDAEGSKVTKTRRQGKLFGLELDSGYVLAFHLRMTGALTLIESAHLRAKISFSKGDDLFFSDPRRFGTIQLVVSDKFGSNQGPDLFTEYDEALGVWEKIRNSSRAIKAVLLDQTVIAGIGNYLADETLFLSKIHPATPTVILDQDDWQKIIKNASSVALTALKNDGVSIRDYKQTDGSQGEMQNLLVCYGRAGRPCVVCRSTLEKMVVGGRGTVFCPHCQAAKTR